jgi:hypothetical protein
VKESRSGGVEESRSEGVHRPPNPQRRWGGVEELRSVSPKSI